MKHGRSAYINKGCRCEVCKADHRQSQAEYRSRRRALLASGEIPYAEHGKISTYNWGCRCDRCREVMSEYTKQIRSIGRSKSRAEETLARDGRCDCCGQNDRGPLVFDHDHRTGIHRGMLCNSCNTGLGKLGDSLEGLALAVQYLQRAGS